MSDPSVMKHVTMRGLSVPSLLVLDTSTHEYYFPPFMSSDDISANQIAAFLDDITTGKIEVEI